MYTEEANMLECCIIELATFPKYCILFHAIRCRDVLSCIARLEDLSNVWLHLSGDGSRQRSDNTHLLQLSAGRRTCVLILTLVKSGEVALNCLACMVCPRSLPCQLVEDSATALQQQPEVDLDEARIAVLNVERSKVSISLCLCRKVRTQTMVHFVCLLQGDRADSIHEKGASIR